jgi:coproporphyrinogen III oxidase-like Fe-S oxidoreductase
MVPPIAGGMGGTGGGAGTGSGGPEGAVPETSRPRPGPGLYLHVPFCSAICPYCDFAVLTGGPRRRAEFVDSLEAEIAAWRPEAERWRTIDTVYFGGGTPSALAPAQLARILAAARAALPVAEDAWIALEANPEDVTAESVERWRDLGIAMLSLGIQSFDEGTLRFLGRRHTPAQARRAVELALGAGFPIVSIDLIYGVGGAAGAGGAGEAGESGHRAAAEPARASPESARGAAHRGGPPTPPAPALAPRDRGRGHLHQPDREAEQARWPRDLEQAVALGPHHLSCYQLTIHEGTLFGYRAARGELRESPEADQAEAFRFTHTFLANRGYAAYEVSNFARAPEHQSRHNRKYWDHTPYLGLGPSAHSFDGRRRWWNERKLRPWQAKLAAGERPVAGSEDLGRRELALEELMLSLRTPAGLDLEAFRRRHACDLAATNRPLIADLAARGLLAETAGRLVPSLEGLAVADSLARGFDLGDVDERGA